MDAWRYQMMMNDETVLEDLLDLQQQAKHEKSHHYTAKILARAIAEIVWLRLQLRRILGPAH